MKTIYPGWGTRKLINNPNIETDETDNADISEANDTDIPISANDESDDYSNYEELDDQKSLRETTRKRTKVATKKESPEAHKKRLAYHKNYHRKRMDSMTPEQKERYNSHSKT